MPGTCRRGLPLLPSRESWRARSSQRLAKGTAQWGPPRSHACPSSSALPRSRPSAAPACFAAALARPDCAGAPHLRQRTKQRRRPGAPARRRKAPGTRRGGGAAGLCARALLWGAPRPAIVVRLGCGERPRPRGWLDCGEGEAPGDRPGRQSSPRGGEGPPSRLPSTAPGSSHRRRRAAPPGRAFPQPFPGSSGARPPPASREGGCAFPRREAAPPHVLPLRRERAEPREPSPSLGRGRHRSGRRRGHRKACLERPAAHRRAPSCRPPSRRGPRPEPDTHNPKAAENPSPAVQAQRGRARTAPARLSVRLHPFGSRPTRVASALPSQALPRIRSWAGWGDSLWLPRQLLSPLRPRLPVALLRRGSSRTTSPSSLLPMTSRFSPSWSFPQDLSFKASSSLHISPLL